MQSKKITSIMRRLFMAFCFLIVISLINPIGFLGETNNVTVFAATKGKTKKKKKKADKNPYGISIKDQSPGHEISDCIPVYFQFPYTFSAKIHIRNKKGRSKMSIKSLNPSVVQVKKVTSDTVTFTVFKVGKAKIRAKYKEGRGQVL